MLTIISPAKKLTSNALAPHKNSTEIDFKKDTTTLVKQLKNMTVADIAGLMKLSENLARLNFERYQDFNLKGSKEQPSINAMFLFQGDVYQSLDANSLKENDINYAQRHLNILSGLYGLIKPLDLIQPYRLEMGTRLENSKGNNLYNFWQGILADKINANLESHKNKVLLNLASTEYSKAIDKKQLLYPIVNVNFKESKNGQLKTIGIHAKKARGAMARYIIINKADCVDDILNFDMMDYKYQPNLSSSSDLVFAR